LELLDLLAQGEKTVEALAHAARLGVKNTSAHLRTLRGAALVATRRDGLHVFYRLADPAVYDLLRGVQTIAHRQLAEVREIVRDYFTSSDGLEPVSADELAARLARGDVTLLDVRPGDEFAAGHIPGARSLPLADLKRQLAALPADREIIAYCRGAWCVLAVEAAALLSRHGYRVRRLAVGMPDWARRGLPVALAPTPN
jgi:rhodanese-related sulfurtransferase